MFHILFIRSSVERHLGCFQFLIIIQDGFNYTIFVCLFGAFVCGSMCVFVLQYDSEIFLSRTMKNYVRILMCNALNL